MVERDETSDGSVACDLYLHLPLEGRSLLQKLGFLFGSSLGLVGESGRQCGRERECPALVEHLQTLEQRQLHGDPLLREEIPNIHGEQVLCVLVILHLVGCLSSRNGIIVFLLRLLLPHYHSLQFSVFRLHHQSGESHLRVNWERKLGLQSVGRAILILVFKLNGSHSSEDLDSGSDGLERKYFVDVWVGALHQSLTRTPRRCFLVKVRR